jgi:hypothetical protein
MTPANNRNRNALYTLLGTVSDTLAGALPDATVMYENVLWTRADMVAFFIKLRGAMVRTDNGHKEVHAAVDAEDPMHPVARGLLKGLRALAITQLGGQSTSFTSLGFTAKKRTPPSGEALAQAAAKARDTRKARGTKGSKQRKAIKAPAPTTPAVTPTK